MDNLLTVVFEAHNSEQNHHRRYEVTLGRDLLDDWTVEIRYGRCGQGSQTKRFASPKAERMKAIIRDRLRRRLSAPKRIGCSYRLAAFNAATGFDVAAWLPGEVMARFFADATG
jgi:predicted DNA-binding WGR domain protein